MLTFQHTGRPTQQQGRRRLAMGRRLLVAVLSALTLMTSMTFVPFAATPASAEGVTGQFFRDLNDSGVAGDYATPEGGFAGIELSVTDATLTEVATATTAADGSYTIGDLPAGTYTVTATYPEGYRPAAAGAGNDFPTQANPGPGDLWTSTAVVVSTGATGDFNLNGGVSSLALLGLSVPDISPGVLAIETGTAPFDVYGLCPDNPLDPDDTAGDDCSKEDEIVRTNDLITITFSVTADGINDPANNPLEDVVVEQTLTSADGASATYTDLPVSCITTSTPVSEIVDNADGTQTLICNMGSFTNELKLLVVTAKVAGDSPHDSTISTVQHAYEATEAAQPDSYDQIDNTVSAAPRFDLTKGPSDDNPYNATISSSTVSKYENPNTGVEEFGETYYFDLSVLYAGDFRGQEPLENVIEFSDLVDPNFPGWRLVLCDDNAYPGRSLPTGSTDVTDVGSNGSWSCVEDRANGEVDITVTGADTDGDPIPTEGDDGTDLSAGPFVAFTGRIGIWYPFSDFYRIDDPTWTYGDTPIYRTYPLTNEAGNFEPVSITGAQNFGDDGEPTDNQSKLTNVQITIDGARSKHVGDYYYLDGRPFANSWPCSSSRILAGSLVDGQTNTCSAGDGPIQGGQNFYSWMHLRNSGATPWDPADFLLCDLFDNSTQRLTTWSSNGLPVGVSGYVSEDDSYIVEYATGDYDDNVVGDDWTNLQTHVQDCTTPNNDWSTDPFSFDADPTASLDLISGVRVTLVQADFDAGVEPGQGAQVVVAMQARDTFNGGPNDGEPIPAGTEIIDISNSTFAGDNWYWDAVDMFDPVTYSDTGLADRLIYSAYQVRITKTTTGASVADDTVDQVEAGDPIWWALQPAITSVTNGTAQNVVITDVLPVNVELNRLCQAEVDLPDGVTLTLVEEDTPNVGETTLTFDLGDRPTNVAIDPIEICTDTNPFVDASVDVTNRVAIESDGDISPEDARSDERTVRLAQVGAFKVAKMVDSPLELQGDTQTYTIGWQNLSSTLSFSAVDLIDVFAYTGDNGNANNGRIEFDSNYEGSHQLDSFLVMPESTGAAGGDHTETGVWYYTNTDPADVNYDASDASNDFTSGSTQWCTEAELAASGGGCAFALADVTAVRFVSDTVLAPGELATVSFTMDNAGNDAADRYVNRFAAYSATFAAGPVESNEVLVQVLSGSIGDLVFSDVDLDGEYNRDIDLPLEGLTVELIQAGVVIDSTTTDFNGRYDFDELPLGDYLVRVPRASVPAGFSATVDAAPSNDDVNERYDHNATDYLDGAVGTDTITLDADVSGPVPLGNEPRGEDVAGMDDQYQYDSLSNLTIDLGLRGQSDIGIVKDVCIYPDLADCDENNDLAWTQSHEQATAPSNTVWRITVTNTGDLMIDDVTVSDPSVSACDFGPQNYVLPGDVIRYTCESVNEDLSFTNTASVRGIGRDDEELTDTDDAVVTRPSANPDIELVKFVHGEDANNILDPVLLLNGEAEVTFTYTLENTGNISWDTVYAVDDAGTPADTSDDWVVFDSGTGSYDGDTNGDDVLDPGEIWTISMDQPAEDTSYLTPYRNTADVEVEGTWGGDTFTGHDDDPATYYAAMPDITIDKYMVTADGTFEDTAVVQQGDNVTFSYVVANTGNTQLIDVTIDDSDTRVTVTCPTTPLVPGDSFVCTGTGFAYGDGSHYNTAEVTGTPALPDSAGTAVPTGQDDVTDDDDFSADLYVAGVNIEKYTNTIDAEVRTALISAGQSVEWTYVVTNTGTVGLADVTVIDDREGAATLTSGDTDNDDILDVDETWLFSITGTAADLAGATYNNTAEVEGTPDVDGTAGTVTDTDDGAYENAAPDINIEKFVNGYDAAPGELPYVAAGEAVTFTYVVTNTGNTALSDVSVADDIEGPATYVRGDDNGDNILDLTETWTYTIAGVAIVGTYDNVGAVTGTSVDDGATPTEVTDDDPSGYFGAEPGIDIIKTVQGVDADTAADGPNLPVDSAVEWLYTVTNTGNVPLTDVTVGDDIEGAAAYQSGDVDLDGELDTSETWVFAITGVVTAGSYANTGTVEALTPDLDPGTGTDIRPVTDSNPAHHYGAAPGINVVKTANGVDAEPYPVIPVGEPVLWEYTVTNTGNMALMAVGVEDDLEGTADYLSGDADDDGLLDTDETWIFSLEGVATAGAYVNVGTAEGDPANGDGSPAIDENGDSLDPVNDDDPAGYFGGNASIEIVKTVNGLDANDEDTQLLIVPGNAVTWRYTVTNTGEVAIGDVVVNDDIEGAALYLEGDENGDDLLDLDEVWVYELAGVAAAGQYTNVGNVTGTPQFPTNGTDVPVVVTDDDPANLLGVTPEVEIIKYVEGQDADTAADAAVFPVGQDITWTYVVTNTGDSPLTDIEVSDDQGVTVTCELVAVLAPGESMICEGEGEVSEGDYTNIGTVTGIASDANGAPLTDVDGNTIEVTDDNPATHFGATPDIFIAKTVCVGTCVEGGAFAERVDVTERTMATWRFVVTNTGQVPLHNVVVSDPMDPQCGLVIETLDVGEVVNWLCTVRVDAAYTNTATVTAETDFSGPVSDSDVASVTTSAAAVSGSSGTTSNSVPSTLAFTGGNIALMLAAGFWSMMLGLGLVLSSRRKTAAAE